ncbi:hypothetical protein SOASR030_13700 [Leminorella grimontii]|uniref:Uncharacterized protein n=1 Tax=Leminorella grimontii TaxID=82981 RepID=A0AAV5MZH8_9GAMM|nr:hypothetical protein SOASR030_13700 [Leminorella grimontii]VFS56705.1 Uncharacterised protein [Leminorella grimontii]
MPPFGLIELYFYGFIICIPLLVLLIFILRTRESKPKIKEENKRENEQGMGIITAIVCLIVVGTIAILNR